MTNDRSPSRDGRHGADEQSGVAAAQLVVLAAPTAGLHETLGYLRTNHPIKWLNYSQFTTIHNKYFKYLRFNSKEMGDIKLLAASQKNFGQLENFIEYETFLSKSYFTYFAYEFFNKTRIGLT